MFLSKLVTKISTEKELSRTLKNYQERSSLSKNERWAERSQLYIRFPTSGGGGGGGGVGGGGGGGVVIRTNSETEK